MSTPPERYRLVRQNGEPVDFDDLRGPAGPPGSDATVTKTAITTALGRPPATVSGTTLYDAAGTALPVESRVPTMSVARNAAGQPTVITDPVGTLDQIVRGPAGITSFRQDGVTYKITRDPAGRATGVAA